MSRRARARHIGAEIKLRKLLRTCETEIRSRGIDARDSRAKIVVTDHRGPNKILQRWILEDFKPFQITDRVWIRNRLRAAKVRRRLHRRRFRLAHYAAGQYEYDQCHRYQLISHSQSPDAGCSCVVPPSSPCFLLKRIDTFSTT